MQFVFLFSKTLFQNINVLTVSKDFLKDTKLSQDLSTVVKRNKPFFTLTMSNQRQRHVRFSKIFPQMVRHQRDRAERPGKCSTCIKNSFRVHRSKKGDIPLCSQLSVG